MTRCALYVVASMHTDSASCGYTHTDSASCSYGFVEYSLRGGAEACKRTLDNSIAPSPLSPAFTQISTVYPSMIGRSVALLPVSRARAMAYAHRVGLKPKDRSFCASTHSSTRRLFFAVRCWQLRKLAADAG